jgi:hypothetical protein
MAAPPDSWAIPSTVFHPHINPGTVDHDTTWINGTRPPEAVADPDPDSPNAKMHQHRDRDPLNADNGKYLGYSVWDDRNYRLGGEFGHGYMNIAARYVFDAAFPVLARTDFDAGVVEWEEAVNALERNVNGVPIQMRIDFERVALGAHEIDVTWRDIGAADGFATAFWDPAATDFVFDSNPTLRLNSRDLIRLPGAGPCGNFVRLDAAWHFGGIGAVPNVTRDYEVCNDDGTFDLLTYTFAAYDFYTIALHELGHAWGLDHFGTGLMRTDIAGFVMRDPDAGSIDGVKDLYAIPVPAPASIWLLALGVALLATARCRRTT